MTIETTIIWAVDLIIAEASSMDNVSLAITLVTKQLNVLRIKQS